MVAALLEQAVHGEMLGPVELLLNRKDGGEVIIEAKGLPLQSQGKNLLLGIARDVTARKQAEEALAAHLHFLQLLLDTIPSPIFFKDAQGVYLGCNKAFEGLFGVTREEIVGKTVYDLSPRELADEYRRMDLEVFQDRGPRSMSLESRRRTARRGATWCSRRPRLPRTPPALWADWWASSWI